MPFKRETEKSCEMSLVPKITFCNEAMSEDDEEDDRNEAIEFLVDSNVTFDPFSYQDKNNENNIWTLQDFALRDLLVYLVQKHRIDEVYDSKSKARNWEQLYKDFHNITEKRVAISQLQIVRKWHNWKQYNKAHKKPHPFVVCGNFDPQIVLQKCAQLCEQAKTDATISTILTRGPVECVDQMVSHLICDLEQKDSKSVRKVDNGSETNSLEETLLKRHSFPEIVKIIDRDFLPANPSNCPTKTCAIKRLRNDVELMKFSYEEEMWRTKLENTKLLNLKLQRKADAMDLRFERVQIELAIKKHCIRLGLAESVLKS